MKSTNKLAIKQINGKHGKFFVLTNDSGVSHALKTVGIYQPVVLKTCLSHISPGDTVIDLGANLGSFAVAFAKAVADNQNCGMVYAFEPQRIIYQMLCANVFLNGLPNVHTHNVGLSNSNRKAKIKTKYRGDFTYSDRMAFSQCTVSDDVGQDIELRTLDSFNLQDVALIKIDVELHELQCILGAIDTIKKWRPIIVIELPRNRPDQIIIADKVSAIISDLNYNISPIVRRNGKSKDVLMIPEEK